MTTKIEASLQKVYKTGGRAENVARSLGPNFKVVRGANGVGFRIIKTKPQGVEPATPPSGEELELPSKVSAKGSIIPNRFREKYGKVDMCGDDLSNELMSQTMLMDGHMSLEALEATGEANNINVATRWGHLNTGMQRMNLGNMLRKLMRSGLPVYLISVEKRVVVLYLDKNGQTERHPFATLTEARQAQTMRMGINPVKKSNKFKDTRTAPVNQANKRRAAKKEKEVV